ncbi:MAG: alanine racemase, partial [Rivularia sp. ALOHA_DT_140]|nr:alanine racemase [Rivularia sp. ALOHA_DT_140]
MNQHHIEVTVSADKFKNNISHIRNQVQPSQLCVVMKANAYGHGLEKLAPTAIAAGADYIGICTNPEATVIRNLDLEAAKNIKLLRL